MLVLVLVLVLVLGMGVGVGVGDVRKGCELSILVNDIKTIMYNG